jgi:hypothetical protein
MIDVKRIFPECNADTLLVELIIKRGKPAHYKGISKVANAIEKFEHHHLFVVGVVDDDKFTRVPRYLNEFETVLDQKEDNIKVLRERGTQKHIIKIVPALEKWIWMVAEGCGIDAAQYGFDSWQYLKDNVTKDETIYQNTNFKKFINAIIAKNPQPIQTLTTWLSKASTSL